MNQQFNITRADLLKERREIINHLIDNYIHDCYNPEEKDFLITNYRLSGDMNDTDDDIWDNIQGETYINGMYLFYTSVTEFNKELKDLFKECREAFTEDDIRVRNIIKEKEEDKKCCRSCIIC